MLDGYFMIYLIWHRFIQQQRRFSSLLPFLSLVLITLACNVLGQADERAIVIRTHLPTLTATPFDVPASEAIISPTVIPVTGEPVHNNSPPTLSPTPLNTAATSIPSNQNITQLPTPIPLPTFTVEPATNLTSQPASESIEASVVVTSSSPPPDVTPTGLNDTQTNVPVEVAPETFTPTSTATAEATATEIPTATHTPAPTATAAPNIDTPGWDITGIRLSTEQFDDRVALYGNLINNTGSAQEIASITGTFRDAEGQDIANAENIIDYWPLELIPPGAQMPFELTVWDIQSVANFDLRVVAEPSSQTLRQDFEFSELDQWADGSGEYCVAGNIGNLGDAWEEAWQGYLVIVVTLYDSQDKVISFGEEGSIAGGDTLSFEICSQTFNQEVARYELGAWER